MSGEYCGKYGNKIVMVDMDIMYDVRLELDLECDSDRTGSLRWLYKCSKVRTDSIFLS
jgi:hypothetical protein